MGQEGWPEGRVFRDRSIWWTVGRHWRKPSYFVCCRIPSSREVPGTYWARDQSAVNELNESHRLCLLRFFVPGNIHRHPKGFPGGAGVKNLPANARDTRVMVSIPGSGRSPEVGNGNPLQYFCLGNPTDRGAWGATALAVARVRHLLATKQQQQTCINS